MALAAGDASQCHRRCDFAIRGVSVAMATAAARRLVRRAGESASFLRFLSSWRVSRGGEGLAPRGRGAPPCSSLKLCYIWVTYGLLRGHWRTSVSVNSCNLYILMAESLCHAAQWSRRRCGLRFNGAVPRWTTVAPTLRAPIQRSCATLDNGRADAAGSDSTEL